MGSMRKRRMMRKMIIPNEKLTKQEWAKKHAKELENAISCSVILDKDGYVKKYHISGG